MTRHDVTIFGAGIFGLSLAWALVARGAKVQVLEKTAIGAGASGGVVGALAPHAPEKWNPMKAFQLASLLRAEEFWAEVEAAAGQPSSYARTGRVQVIENDAGLALAEERALAAKDLWQGRAFWRVTRRPQNTALLPPSPTGLYIEDSLSARIAPRQATATLVRALASRGCPLVLGGDAESYSPKAGEAVVHATGVAGLVALSQAFGKKIGSGVKGQGALFHLDARHAPQIYGPGLHIIPHFDGTLALGSTSETIFTHDEVDQGLEDLIAKARAYLPALGAAPLLQRWAGLRPRAISRAPILGPWPGRAGHFVMNGGFKTGFGMAPRAAEVLAAHILGAEDAIPAPLRFEALV